MAYWSAHATSGNPFGSSSSIHHSMLHVAAADCITCELFKSWLLSHLNPTKPPLESCMPLPCIAASWLSVSLCNTITITHHLSGKQMMLHVTLSSHIRCRQRLEREANGGYTLGQALRLDSERKPGQQQQHNAECQEQRTADTRRRQNADGTSVDTQDEQHKQGSTARPLHNGG